MLCVVGVWFPSEPAACWVSLHEKERKKKRREKSRHVYSGTHASRTHTRERERERETMKTFPVGMKEEDKRKGEMMNAGKKRKG